MQRLLPLAGEWRFAADPQNAGVAENWAARGLSGTIRLPGTTDEAGIGGPGPERNGVLTRRHECIGAAWCQCEIVITEAWRKQEAELLLERVIWQSRYSPGTGSGASRSCSSDSPG